MAEATATGINTPPGLAPSTRLAACAHCDQLLYSPADPQQILCCPVCGSRQFELEPFTPSTPLAIALAGLVAALPANFYPQLSFALLGQPNYYTLAGGGLHLIDQGFFWVGALVIAGTVVAPLTILLLICATTLAWYAKLPNHAITPLLKGYKMLVNWVMLDVYLLSVIVSVVKLKGMGQLDFTLGFYCFIVMMLLTSAAALAFKTGPFWDLLEHRHHARH